MVEKTYPSQSRFAEQKVEDNIQIGYNKKILSALLVALLFVLVSCGGGGGNDHPPKQPSDEIQPIFEGLASITVFSSPEAGLVWKSATDDTTPASKITYLIYTSTVPGEQNFSEPSLITPPGVTTFTVTGLNPDVAYYFVVRAVDEAGNIDSNTVERSIVTPSFPDPAKALDNWHWRYPLPQRNYLLSVAFGNNTFVSFGVGSGPLLTSSDGVSWSVVTSPLYTGIQKVIFAKNLFVATGFGGKILTSSDGHTWVERNSGVSQLSNVAFGNNTFVAVGTGAIVASPDGVTWTQVFSHPMNYHISCIAYGNNTFIAIGIGPTAYKSSDGIAWEEEAVVATNCGRGFNNLTFGNGVFVATGDTGSVLSSPDGISWTQRYSICDDSEPCCYCQFCGNFYREVSFQNGIFFAGGARTFDESILTSSDGITWVSKDLGLRLSHVAFGNSTYVAVGGLGNIMTSPDTATWTRRNSEPYIGGNLSKAIFGGDRYVAVGTNPATNEAISMTSTDGVNWVRNDISSDVRLLDVAYGNGIFVAGGGRHYVDTAFLISSDGLNWVTRRLSSIASWIRGITFGNNIFVAVAANGTILTSPDGKKWVQRDSGVSGLSAVTFGNNIFIAVGQGTILTSPDGILWERIDSGLISPNDIFEGAAYGSGTYVVIGAGYGNDILLSSDGSTWRKKDLGAYLRSIAYGGGVFAVTGNQGIASESVLLTSPDGETWTVRNSGSAGTISYANGTFFIVGGSILQSDPLR